MGYSFSGFRWAIPESCNFEGRAIYMDADVIVLCDIAELWSHPMQDDAIVIAKGGKSSARLCTCGIVKKPNNIFQH
jgi:lipopolysaccharide biosynthesis glycosyltransferase